MSILVLASAYLLGSVPWAYVIARAQGKDVRRLGDGNVGAHNVMRHVNRGLGTLVLLLDAGKGAFAVLLARFAADDVWLPVLAGWISVIGHNYPIWLRFRGGKGLATSLGVALALFPRLVLLIVIAALLTIAATKDLAFSGVVVAAVLTGVLLVQGQPVLLALAPLVLLLLMGLRQLPDLIRMWHEAPDKRDLLLNRWIRDRDGEL